jgi:hypothetical protein
MLICVKYCIVIKVEDVNQPLKRLGRFFELYVLGSFHSFPLLQAN